MRLAGSLGAVMVVGLCASAAWAERTMQVTPDGRHTLVTKVIGGAQWAIALDSADDGVIGSVVGESGTDFLYCTPKPTRRRTDVELSCETAPPCNSSPCDAAQWGFAYVSHLPLSFFQPPVGPQPTPVPVSGLQALRGSWRFAYAAQTPVVLTYDLQDIYWQLGRPLLLGLDETVAAVTLTYYAGLGPAGAPPYEFGMLDPGPTSCLLHLFDRSATGGIAGVTYVVEVGLAGECLAVAAGQESFALAGQRTTSEEQASAGGAAQPAEAAAASRIVELLQARR